MQCPTETLLHPDTDMDADTREEGIECIHLVAGDGMVTMADDIGKTPYILCFARVDLPGQNGAPTELSGEYPGWVMAQGMLAANAPAPTISVDEDDELFLSLTNAGMAMRPTYSTRTPCTGTAFRRRRPYSTASPIPRTAAFAG